ncbi:MAG: hypothetical protein AB1414_04555 [bacterium]
MKAGNSLGWSSWSSEWSFINGPSSIPDTPTLGTPTNGSNFPGTKVEFRWHVADRANNYHIQVSLDSNFTQLIFDEAIGNYIGVDISGFPDNGTQYWWRVKAGNTLGWSSWSEEWNFINGPSSIPDTPTLGTPTNGSNFPGTKVEFRWHVADRANNYHIQVSLDSNFTKLIFDEAIGNYIGVDISGFPDNGIQYWWRVKAGNTLGWSSWSSEWNFINGPSSIPDTPTLGTPTNGSNFPGTKVEFRWHVADRANNYHIQVSLDSNFTKLIFDEEIGNYIGVDISGFPDNGTQYWWRVKAGNTLGWSSWSEEWNFINGPSSIPDTPTLGTPTNGSNFPGTKVEFRWHVADRANNYHIQVSLDSNFTKLIFDEAIGNYIGVDISGFPDNGTKYWWRVKAGNSLGWSSWSSEWNFINGPTDKPDTPELIRPEDGTNIPGNVVQFRWYPAPRANNYHLQIALDSSFSKFVFDKAIGNYIGVDMSGFLDDGTQYWWRVKAGNVLGTSSWSAEWNFINGPSGIPESPILIQPKDGVNVPGQMIQFRWYPAPRANNYHLQVALDSGFTKFVFDKAIGNYIGVDMSGFLDDGTQYWWRVKAGNVLGTSSWSAEWAFINGLSNKPSPPTGVIAKSGPGSRQITLIWNANPEPELDYYRIYLGTSSGNYFGYFDKVPKEWHTGVIISGLTNGTTYYIVVTAVNISGVESDYSEEVSATPEDIGDTEPPTKPTNLNINDPETGEELELSWDASIDNVEVSHYLIYRLTNNSAVSESNYDSGFPVSTSKTNYTDYEVTEANTYYYKVLAVDTSDNRSGLSNLADASPTDTLAPAEPTNVNTTPGDTIIDLWWTAPTTNTDNSELTDLAGYNIYRGTSPGNYNPEPINGLTLITTLYYNDTGLINEQTYYYIVKAVDDSGNEGPASIEVSETPVGTDTPPAPPTDVMITEKETELLITWAPNHELDLAGYNIYRGIESGNYSPTPINPSLITTESYTDRDVVENQTYFYVVRAVDESGQESDNSEEVSGMIGEGVIWIIKPTSSNPARLYFNQEQVTTKGLPTTSIQDKEQVIIEYHLSEDYLDLYPLSIIRLEIKNYYTGELVYTAWDYKPFPSITDDPHFIWNGRNNDGKVVPNGLYTTTISIYLFNIIKWSTQEGRNIIIGTKVRLGGQIDSTAEPGFFEVYVPTKYGGVLTISAPGCTIEIFDPKGNPFTNGTEVGENNHGWFTFKVSGAKNYTVSNTFVEKGEATTRPWNGWYWPTEPNTNPNLYDDGYALDKYDQVYNTSAQNWEVTNHVGVEPWEGHCWGWSIASIVKSQPEPTEQDSIKFDQDDMEGLYIELADCGWYGSVLVDNIPSEPTPALGESVDRYADDVHIALRDHIRRSHIALQSNLRGVNNPNEIWNHAVWKYSANMEQSPDQNDEYVIKITIIIYANEDFNYPSNGTSDRIETYTYILKYTFTGEIDKTYLEQNWIRAEHYALQNLYKVTNSMWNAKNPFVSKTNVDNLYK